MLDEKTYNSIISNLDEIMRMLNKMISNIRHANR